MKMFFPTGTYPFQFTVAKKFSEMSLATLRKTVQYFLAYYLTLFYVVRKRPIMPMT